MEPMKLHFVGFKQKIVNTITLKCLSSLKCSTFLKKQIDFYVFVFYWPYLGLVKDKKGVGAKDPYSWYASLNINVTDQTAGWLQVTYWLVLRHF